MVSWQIEMGNLSEAFSAMERARARTLVDQMQRRGVDLLAGLPADQAEPCASERPRPAGSSSSSKSNSAFSINNAT